MKITRYIQSCLLVEEGGTRILFDPSGEEEDIAKFGKLDVVIYTHEHGDHFDPEFNEKFAATGVPIYANASTAKQMKSQPNVVADQQEFQVGQLNIKALELPHCLLPDGSEGPQNTGYLVSDNFFHPGDGKELDGLQVEKLALPITGPDISMKDCFSFAKRLSAKIIVPIHYDKIGANPEVYAAFAARFPEYGYQFKVLKVGESAEL